MLPKQAVVEYQQIYRKVFGKKISFKRALKQANQLVNLVLIIENENKDEELHDNPQRTS